MWAEGGSDVGARRETDFSPLAAADPVPGDPDDVARLARRYRATADMITRQAENLRRLAERGGASWDSDAGNAFAEHADDLVDRIGKAHERYVTAAGVLDRWVEPLRRAQEDVDAAVVAARKQQAQMRANQPSPAPSSTAPPPTPEQLATERTRASNYETAQSSFDAAKRRFDTAVEDYQSTARRLAGDLHKVIDHDGVHDSFWDRVGGWIDDHAGVLKSVLKITSYVVTALAVTALVISLFIPGLDLLTGPLTVMIAAGLGGMLVGHTALATVGDGSWLDVGLDLFAIATAGLASGAASAGEVAAEEATDVAADTAASSASDAVNAANASRIRLLRFADRFPVVRTLVGAGAKLDGMAAEAAEAADAAGGEIRALPKVSTTLAQRWRYLDGAKSVAAIDRLTDLVPEAPGLDELAATARSRGVAGAVLTYTGNAVDITNHVVEERFPSFKEFFNKYTTAPVTPLPYPVGEGE